MDRSALAPFIDHTVLGPETTPDDVATVLDAAETHGMNACIPPCYVEEVADAYSAVTVATVVGFPHGQHAPASKREEAVEAWRAGADELDVVCNVGRLKAGDDGAVERELEELVAAVPIPVKVIVEAPLLSDGELHRACEAAVAADAAMVKTATGFAGAGSANHRASGEGTSGGATSKDGTSGGATAEDVAIMAEYLPVKASGGIGSYEEAMAMIEAGAERIGASSGVEILDGAPEA